MGPRPEVSLSTIVREWGRIGCIGFGGPPTHIALLRQLCVDHKKWMPAAEFEDGIAAANVLPGPSSTQLAIFCAWRLRGVAGGVLGGLCFIIPGLVLILVLASVVLQSHPPSGIVGAAVGAGAAVPAVALRAATDLVPASRARTNRNRAQKLRWAVYVLLGGLAAATVGPYLVIVLLCCGLMEVAIHSKRDPTFGRSAAAMLLTTAGHGVVVGGLGALAWVALKVGALSYGGGFVIVPLMQHDAVTTYHWMTGGQFLSAVALGQVTPGPVVQTVAVVGYAAGGVGAGLLAALVAFAPSFFFVLVGAPRFRQVRANPSVQAFFSGAGPAAIGAIAGSAVSLGLTFQHLWQIPVLGGALLWLFALRRGVVSALLLAGVMGVVLSLAGVSV
ncbi:MAG: chromate efflux transporter [Acidimicrobiales bacterium]